MVLLVGALVELESRAASRHAALLFLEVAENILFGHVLLGARALPLLALLRNGLEGLLGRLECLILLCFYFLLFFLNGVRVL